MSADHESAEPLGALDVPDELAIAAIIEGKPIYEAAELAGYSARTLQRRQHEPEFKRRLAEVRNDRVAQIAGQLGSLVDEAIHALRRSLNDELFPQNSLRAATVVLDKYRVFRKEFEVAQEMNAMREELRALRAVVDAREVNTDEGVAS
jgi:hypothetical protein